MTESSQVTGSRRSGLPVSCAPVCGKAEAVDLVTWRPVNFATPRAVWIGDFRRCLAAHWQADGIQQQVSTLQAAWQPPADGSSAPPAAPRPPWASALLAARTTALATWETLSHCASISSCAVTPCLQWGQSAARAVAWGSQKLHLMDSLSAAVWEV